MDLLAYAPQSKVLTSTGTAVTSLLPLDQSSGYPKEIRITATAPCYVEIGGIGTTAVAGDILVQPKDPITLATCGAQSISVISVSGTASITVTALESGATLSALTNPSLSLDMLSGVLASYVTFTRASSGTYFDSTGRLVTASNDVARFDYDPATPAGTVGPELVTNGDFSQGAAGWGVGSEWTVSNGEARIVATGAYSNLQWDGISPITGKTFLVKFDVTVAGTGGLQIQMGTGAQSSVSVATTGPRSLYLVGGGAGNYLRIQQRFDLTSCTIDNISVQEVTFTPRGLLIEEQRTNLLLHSRDMTQAAWSKTDVTAARTQVGIDGVASSACLMTEGSAGSARAQQNGAAVTAGSVITSSIVVKRGNCDWIRLLAGETTLTNYGQAWFNLATGAKGAATAVGSATGVSSTIVNLGGGWYRCTVTATPDGAYTVPSQWIQSAASDGVNTRVPNATYIVDAAQLEVGSFATSIITTGAATVTRAADSASMTGTNFSSWYNQTQGTFVAETTQIAPNNSAGIVSRSDAGNADLLFGGYTLQRTRDAVPTVINSNAFTAATFGSIVKGAMSYDASGRSVTGQGLTAVTGTYDLSYATMVGINIGKNGGSTIMLNGWLRRLSYYPTRLSNATLQALTS